MEISSSPVPPDDSPDSELMASVCLNPVILGVIFSKLDAASLKSVRQICQLWADLAACPLGKKTIIRLHKLCPLVLKHVVDGNFIYTTYNLIPPPPSINRKLVKHLRVKFSRNPDSPYSMENDPNMIGYFTSFISQLESNGNGYTPVSLISLSLVNVPIRFITFFFPKLLSIQALESLSIDGITRGDVQDPVLLSPLPPGSPGLKNLKKLSVCLPFPFWFLSNYDEIRDNEIKMRGGIYAPICQSIINSSPNLSQLCVWGYSWYPDLSLCHKLKNLIYHIHTDDPLSNHFQPREITRMCHGVRSSLEMVHFGLFGNPGDRDPQMKELRFPWLPALKILNIDPRLVHVGHCVTRSRLPALKRLEIICSSKLAPDGLTWNSSVPHKLIEEIEIKLESVGLSQIEGITNLLPNIKRATLILECRDTDEDRTSFQETLDAMNTGWMSLVESELTVQFCRGSYSSLATVLDSVGRLRGIKKLNLPCWDNSNRHDDKLEPFKERIKSALSLFFNFNEIKMEYAKVSQELMDTVSEMRVESNIKISFDEFLKIDEQTEDEETIKVC